MDCEFLKKCCENLSEENRRLKKELEELRSQRNIETSTTLYTTQIPKDEKLKICSSCEKIVNNIPLINHINGDEDPEEF